MNWDSIELLLRVTTNYFTFCNMLIWNLVVHHFTFCLGRFGRSLVPFNKSLPSLPKKKKNLHLVGLEFPISPSNKLIWENFLLEMC